MNTVADYMQWLEHSDYNEWYRYIRNFYFADNYWCAYEQLTKDQCYARIQIEEQNKEYCLTFLHPMSWSVVSCQVFIDLLYVRISQIHQEESVQKRKIKNY